MIELFNTLGRKKQEFLPLIEGKVGMYNCGPTVYKSAHIGNLRAYVFADILRRTLEYTGLQVNQIINITDVGHLTSDQDIGEDKLEKRAREQKMSAQEIAAKYTDEFIQDISSLNIEAAKEFPAHFPKASEHIEDQIEIIKQLQEKGHTYITSDGVYFDTSTFKEYGKLGGIDFDGLKEGARVEKNAEKRNPTDFALWKFSPQEEKRQQEWNSPWGVGFPGWHIECSAMSRKYLGQPFDIHTGGIDHISIHHNNEIAQSECSVSKPLANIWMHSAFVNVANGEKMAKSGDNFLTLNTLKEHGIHPIAYRYWLMTAHYSAQVNFSWEAVQAAQTALERIIGDLLRLEYTDPEVFPDQTYINDFEQFIFDDLDTPSALALIFTILSSKLEPSVKLKTILDMDTVLGLSLELLMKQVSSDIPEEIEALSQKRNLLRTEKQWEASDEIRNRIEEKGYMVQDKNGTSILLKKLKTLI